MSTALLPYQHKALDTCDGVIEIAKNEMLVRGTYLTGILKPDMAREGSICGGRKACLVGSMYLAHGVRGDIEDMSMSFDSRKAEMRNRPGLRLAYQAINEAALRRAEKINAEVVRRERRKNHRDTYRTRPYHATNDGSPEEGWGEWFFESFLRRRTTFDETREEVIRVTRHAKRLIKSGVVR